MARPDSKSPAFQFYPADYLSDINVVLMPNQARGCYITLMSHEWLAKGNGISNQISALAKICGESEEEMALLWQSLEICFIPHPKDDTKLIHPRLEKERKKQKDNRKKRTNAGKQGAKARWQTHSDRNADAMAKDGSSSSTSTSSSTSVKKTSAKKAVKKKPAKTDDEIQDTTKALRAWITEYESQIKDFPDFSPARDNTILKGLVDTHGLDKVLHKIPHHIKSRKLLTIPGFKTCFNSLGIGGSPTMQTRGAKKKQALEEMAKKLGEEPGNIIDMGQPRRINA